MISISLELGQIAAMSDAAISARLVETRQEVARSLEELRDWARDLLAPHKLPRGLVVVDLLPRNALGKVVKGELPCG